MIALKDYVNNLLSEDAVASVTVAKQMTYISRLNGVLADSKTPELTGVDEYLNELADKVHNNESIERVVDNVHYYVNINRSGSFNLYAFKLENTKALAGKYKTNSIELFALAAKYCGLRKFNYRISKVPEDALYLGTIASDKFFYKDNNIIAETKAVGILACAIHGDVNVTAELESMAKSTYATVNINGEQIPIVVGNTAVVGTQTPIVFETEQDSKLLSYIINDAINMLVDYRNATTPNTDCPVQAYNLFSLQDYNEKCVEDNAIWLGDIYINDKVYIACAELVGNLPDKSLSEIKISLCTVGTPLNPVCTPLIITLSIEDLKKINGSTISVKNPSSIPYRIMAYNENLGSKLLEVANSIEVNKQSVTALDHIVEMYDKLPPSVRDSGDTKTILQIMLDMCE